MISLIQGKVISNNGIHLVVLTAGGVGYKVAVKANIIDRFEIGREIVLPTYLAVGENIMNLYGFTDEEERELFIHFLSVSGIGPKSALHLLSLGTVAEISHAISAGDLGYLTKVSGVGKKTAERIIVELKSRLGQTDIIKQTQSGSLAEVIDGLATMGYTVQQAREIVKQLDTAQKSSEELMREALRLLSV